MVLFWHLVRFSEGFGTAPESERSSVDDVAAAAPSGTFAYDVRSGCREGYLQRRNVKDRGGDR